MNEVRLAQGRIEEEEEGCQFPCMNTQRQVRCSALWFIIIKAASTVTKLAVKGLAGARY
jgi:hypothetical protein